MFTDTTSSRVTFGTAQVASEQPQHVQVAVLDLGALELGDQKVELGDQVLQLLRQVTPANRGARHCR